MVPMVMKDDADGVFSPRYVDWRIGAEFFEMHLLDYDTCSKWVNHSSTLACADFDS